MQMPKGISEEEFLTIVDNIGNMLSQKFSFGYFTKEDIKQEIFIEACKGLSSYDGKRPLANFLYIHVKNRLCNLKRNKFERPDKPCLNCPLKAYNLNLPSECTLYTNKNDCELYNNWASRNVPKKNLMNCIDIHNVDDTQERSMHTSNDYVGNMEYDRMVKLIDEHLPMGLRPYYLKIKANQKVSRVHKEEVQNAIQEILEKAGVTLDL